MMDDRDLEARLNTYRPAGPPADLRARVVGDPQSASFAEARTGGGRAKAGVLAWLPAVAAMLLAATLYWLAASDRTRLFAQFPTVDADETVEWQLENQP